MSLCDQVNCPIYIVHVMSKSAAQAVMRGKEKGSEWHSSCSVGGFLPHRSRGVWRADCCLPGYRRNQLLAQVLETRSGLCDGTSTET